MCVNLFNNSINGSYPQMRGGGFSSPKADRKIGGFENAGSSYKVNTRQAQ